ncbi:MAG TPA: phage major capsid protein, partial [Mariniphaga sp.]|nr:phage major capsid protein [Mariniphaga sp.]
MAVTKEQVEEIQEVVAKLRKEIDGVAEVKGNVNKTTEKMENLQDAIDKMEEKMGTVNSLDEKIKEQENIIANLEEFKKKATDFAGFETKEKEEKAKKEMEAERTAFFEYARKGDKNVGADYRKDLSSLSDSEGGYTVPEDYRQQLISKLPDESVMRGLVTVANTSRDEVKVPSLDGTFAW